MKHRRILNAMLAMLLVATTAQQTRAAKTGLLIWDCYTASTILTH